MKTDIEILTIRCKFIKSSISEKSVAEKNNETKVDHPKLLLMYPAGKCPFELIANAYVKYSAASCLIGTSKGRKYNLITNARIIKIIKIVTLLSNFMKVFCSLIFHHVFDYFIFIICK